MSVQRDQIQNANAARKWRQLVPWLWFALAFVWFSAFALLDHAGGRSWASAFGLPWDRNILRLIGDLAIPVLAVLYMMRNIRKLPLSPEKMSLTRIGWALFVFLFVWELIRHFYLGQLRIL